ncbi:protein-methionine-sulfoxide reductase catalytic subunit MsrP [Alteromonas gracilis]|uniref:protein-methionine-sulfoxide reductase catalytic subunit MsrP n=1 Tax=Alteromonas gracilis TaxID=1479524 RepID=UPI0030CB4F2B
MKYFTSSEITSESIFHNRRYFIKQALCSGLLAATPRIARGHTNNVNAITPMRMASTYCNYYEFSDNKKVVHHLAKELTTSPWALRIDGEVSSPKTLDVSQLTPTVSRVYPMRCVEGWTAVIPWQGIVLSELLSLVSPKETARYVKFYSVFRPSEMPMQRRQHFPWPYVEGLRLDEAMHPLTILATGMYDKSLTKQNGAPIRLVVPWKYGYKSIKAITRIELTQSQPVGAWEQASPSEYTFYANVNPKEPHPRWSQRRELFLGEKQKRPTKLFNGFAEQVASLYSE